MTADISITDGSNIIVLNVDEWTYDLQRTPKEFTLKFLPSLGTTKSITTDFGSFTEFYSLRGWFNTRNTAQQLIDFSSDEWFVNRPITVAIAALNADDDAIDITTKSGTEAVITRARISSDLDSDGVASLRFEVAFAVCKRL